METGAGGLYQQFMAALQVEKGASQHTLDAYGGDLQRFFAWMGWDAEPRVEQLAAVDAQVIRRYLGHLSRQGLARKSIARSLAALRSFYRFGVRRGWWDRSPLTGVATPKIPRNLPSFLQQDEMQRLLDAPSDQTPLGIRDRALLELLYATGIRLAELVGLNVQDVELPAGDDRAGAGPVGRILVMGKGGVERFVPLGSMAAAALKRYINVARPQLLRQRGAAGENEEALFLGRSGRRISRRGVDYVIKKYARQVGLHQRVTPHSFRHTFATHLLEGGADLRSVQELLGHTAITSTQIYTHVTPERLRAAYKGAHPRA